MTDSDPVKLALGQRLAEARKLAAMSQPEVATHLKGMGYTAEGKGTVSAWETGRNVPDVLVLRALAKLYDASADVLLGLNERSVQADRIAAAFDSLPMQLQTVFMEMCGPFLQKHALDRGADLTTSDDDTGRNLQQAGLVTAYPQSGSRKNRAVIRKRSA